MLDIQYLLFLQDLRVGLGGPITGLFRIITALGDFAFLFPMAGCILWCGNKRLANQILFVLCAGSMVISSLKVAACVSRPWLKDPRIHPDGAAVKTATGYSFPSGHAAGATGLFGTIALYLRGFHRDPHGVGLHETDISPGTRQAKGHRAKGHRALAALCIALALLVGFSRNWLGVHTPQDVVASLIACGVLVPLARTLFTRMEEDARTKRIAVAACALAAIGLAAYAALKPYPETFADGSPTDVVAMAEGSFAGAGALLGFLIGWLAEERFVGFDAPKHRSYLVARCVFGIAGLYALSVLLPAVLSGMHAWVGAFAGGFLGVMYMMLLYPAVFVWVEARMARSRAARRR
ncbi:MAG: phosphatase PAP2 family protein [Coriobacteriia bacterium]|nr:phosphatase PAP2 family protein [Coriobacteriia bacterium]